MEGLTCPALKRLYEYWLEKKASRFAPARSDIDPVEILPILPHVIIMDVLGTPPRFRYRLVGTAFVQAYGQEITGKFVDEIDLDGQREFIIADYQKMLREREPSLSRWEYTKTDGRHILYERLLLPLSKDGETIDMLLGAVTAKGYASSW
jgi:hypothetical protein